MFELWKVIKRNPVTYYPRAVGLIVLGYLSISFWRQNTSDWLHNNYKYFGEKHSLENVEELRQYRSKKSQEFIEYVLKERKKHQEMLLSQAAPQDD